MSSIRYRRPSLKTMLGVTKAKKEIKRALGITALLKPFRWWGNEKRTIKRDLGYYSPEAKLARHVLPHSTDKLLVVLLLILAIPFAIGWFLSSAVSTPSNSDQPASVEWPSTADRSPSQYR